MRNEILKLICDNLLSGGVEFQSKVRVPRGAGRRCVEPKAN